MSRQCGNGSERSSDGAIIWLPRPVPPAGGLNNGEFYLEEASAPHHGKTDVVGRGQEGPGGRQGISDDTWPGRRML